MALKNIIYLSVENYIALKETGTVIINGRTITYSEDDFYCVPDNSEELIAAIQAKVATFDAKANNLVLNGAYPVGSIYISVNETSPASLFSGTWEQLKDKFLLASGDNYAAGSTGGSADAVVVRHQHGMEVLYAGSGGNAWDGNTLQRGYEGEYHYDTPNSTANSLTAFEGEDGTGKNMPPYLAVYVWKRIS